MKFFKQLLLLAFIILLAAPASAKDSKKAQNAGEVFSESRDMMSTQVEISCFYHDEKAAKEGFAAAYSEMERLIDILSAYKPDSQVSKINNAAGKEPVVVSPELIYIIRKSLIISELTQGAFDVSFASLGSLWKFHGEGAGKIPTDDEIKAKLPLVNHHNIRVDAVKNTVFLKKEGMKIGLGGISKGYIVDKAIEMLKQYNLENCFVNAGGDIAFSGDKGGKPWRVGIKDPDKKKPFIASVEIAGKGALVTSGDYERFFMKGGKRYHHIINPKTGKPVNNGIRSVTVVAESAIESDAFATAIFVLGPKKGFAQAKNRKSFEACIILDGDREPLVTDGLKDKITWVK